MTKNDLLFLTSSIIRAHFCRLCFPEELGKKECSFLKAKWFLDLQKTIYYRLSVKRESMRLVLSALLQTCEVQESKHPDHHKGQITLDEAVQEFHKIFSACLLENSLSHQVDEDALLTSPGLLQWLDMLFPTQ